MFERFLKFFLINSRMNYTLFFLIFALGIYSYIKTPKEIFPSFELDMISIRGSYAGASVDILNKMAVNEIEDNIKNINGIDTISSIISPGSFVIIVELKKGENRYNIANKFKDAVSITKSSLPSDMDEPSVNVIEIKRDLIDMSIYSNKLSFFDLKQIAKDVKDEIMNIKNISEVVMYGDSDKYYEIILDESKIEAFNLNKNDIYTAISTLSYTYPIGKLEAKEHFYISTNNGPKNIQEFENSVLKINNNLIYLKDIAKVSKRYEDTSTMFSIEANNALNLKIKMNNQGNSIVITEQINKLIPLLKKDFTDVEFILRDDNSDKIRDRLNIVISNIILGVLLITLLVIVLINKRMAFVIAVGVPTSFVMGALYFYLFGYTINMISLVGVLIALGIVVDDAIVVTENIQQHIEDGMEPKEASLLGAKEMFKPVTIASLTTLFSFIPILMISGTMGEVMKLIPIAFSVLIVASLIESFVFLPIHAAHTLKKGAKTLSWNRINKIYSKIIHYLMHFKKSFLVTFIILVPLLTFISLKNSKFQMFPKFDASTINITIKANANTKLEESYKIVQSIEEDLLKVKEKFHIKTISSVAGYTSNSGGNTENSSYVMYMTLELHKLKAMNFVDKYITPYLSFYYSEEGRSRDIKSAQVSRKLSKWLEKKNYIQKYNLTNLAIKQRKVGPVKADVKIGFSAVDYFKVIKHIDIIQKEIKKQKGILSVSNSANFGNDEIKVAINSYGQSLGLSESYVGNILSNIYATKKKSSTFEPEGMLDIKIESKNKDSYSNFENLELSLNDGTVVALKDVATFKIIKSFEKLTKDNTEVNFFLYANVDSKIVTASEVLEKLQVKLDDAQKDGIKLIFKGEDEKKESLKSDMLGALSLALILIMLSLIYLFNSFRDTFIVMSVIPFSFLGVLVGHFIIGINLTMPGIIGALGLAGVVINDGIIMMTYLKKSKNVEDVFYYSAKRFRPIVLTTITTVIGLSSLIFFPTGQAAIFQPMAIALGFGLLWGTVLNLLYIPVLYTLVNKLK